MLCHITRMSFYRIVGSPADGKSPVCIWDEITSPAFKWRTLTINFFKGASIAEFMHWYDCTVWWDVSYWRTALKDIGPSPPWLEMTCQWRSAVLYLSFRSCIKIQSNFNWPVMNLKTCPIWSIYVEQSFKSEALVLMKLLARHNFAFTDAAVCCATVLTMQFEQLREAPSYRIWCLPVHIHKMLEGSFLRCLSDDDNQYLHYLVFMKSEVLFNFERKLQCECLDWFIDTL